MLPLFQEGVASIIAKIGSAHHVRSLFVFFFKIIRISEKR